MANRAFALLACLLLPVAAVAGDPDATADAKHTPAELAARAELEATLKESSQRRRAVLAARIAETESLADLVAAIELDVTGPSSATKLRGVRYPDDTDAIIDARVKREAALLARLLDLHPDEPLVRHLVAAFCAPPDAPSGRPCERYDAIRAYADAEPRNAVPWLMWAKRAHERGDTVDVWWALARAAQAERADFHVQDHYRALRAFVASADPPGVASSEFDRAMGFFDLMFGSAIRGYEAVGGPCGETATTSGTPLTREQKATCSRIGRLLAAAPTLLEAHAGARMLERHAHTSGERRAATDERARQDALRSAHQLLEPSSSAVPTADEQRALVAYVDDFVEIGEMAAMQRVVERAGYTMDAWIAASRKVNAERDGVRR